MTDTATRPTDELAEQPTPEPTNKVVAASNIGGLAGALLGFIAATGSDAIREIWIAAVPPALETEAISGLVVGIILTAAGFFGVKYASKAGAYNVLDRVNIPLSSARGFLRR